MFCKLKEFFTRKRSREKEKPCLVLPEQRTFSNAAKETQTSPHIVQDGPAKEGEAFRMISSHLSSYKEGMDPSNTGKIERLSSYKEGRAFSNAVKEGVDCLDASPVLYHQPHITLSNSSPLMKFRSHSGPGRMQSQSQKEISSLAVEISEIKNLIMLLYRDMNILKEIIERSSDIKSSNNRCVYHQREDHSPTSPVSNRISTRRNS